MIGREQRKLREISCRASYHDFKSSRYTFNALHMFEIQHPQPFVKHILMVSPVSIRKSNVLDEILILAFTMKSMKGIEDETLSEIRRMT